MDANEGRSDRLYFSLQGVDLNDDASIEAFASAVWERVMHEWKGDDVPAAMPFESATVPSTVLTSKYAEAVAYASVLHGDQTRKGSDTTYLCHLLGVSALVLEAGGTETQAIAGLLHDAGEDRGGRPRVAQIARLFGDDVARIVEGCSDSLTDDPNAKDDWRTRKTHHLANLLEADADIVIVTAADKLHNARAILADVQREGLDYLRHFSNPAGIVWYYASMLQVLTLRRAPASLLIPLAETVYALADIVRRGHPADQVEAAAERAVEAVDYLSDWRTRTWHSPCGWSGAGESALVRECDDAASVVCPSCARPIATILRSGS